MMFLPKLKPTYIVGIVKYHIIGKMLIPTEGTFRSFAILPDLLLDASNDSTPCQTVSRDTVNFHTSSTVHWQGGTGLQVRVIQQARAFV